TGICRSSRTSLAATDRGSSPPDPPAALELSVGASSWRSCERSSARRSCPRSRARDGRTTPRRESGARAARRRDGADGVDGLGGARHTDQRSRSRRVVLRGPGPPSRAVWLRALRLHPGLVVLALEGQRPEAGGSGLRGRVAAARALPCAPHAAARRLVLATEL